MVRPNFEVQSRYENRNQYKNWDQESMDKAVTECARGEISIRGAAKKYQIPRGTIQDRIHKRVKNGVAVGRPPRLDHADEQKLIDYASNRAQMGVGFNKQNFMRYAGSLALKRRKSFKNQTPSDKWYRGLKARVGGISLRKAEGTAAVRQSCMNQQYVGRYFDALTAVIVDNELQDKPESIWNMDETGCSMSHSPGLIVAKTGSKYLQSRVSSTREMVTVLVAGNAQGRVLPPMNIIKGKTTRTLQTVRTGDAPPGSRFSVSDSGWTKMGIMELWFCEHFLPLIGDARPQILILDGHNSHSFVELLQVAQRNQIIIVELPEHTSHWLQPMDRCVFGPFKKAYNTACQTLMNDNPGTVVSKATFCGLLKKAWDSSMTKTNVASGFRACGIYPLDRNAIPVEAYQPSMVSTLATTPEKIVGAADIDQPLDSFEHLKSSGIVHGEDGDTSLTVVDLNDPAILSMLTEGTGFDALVNSSSTLAEEDIMITDADAITGTNSVEDMAYSTPLAPVAVATSPLAHVALSTSPVAPMAATTSPLAHVVVSTSPHAPVTINTSPLTPVAVSASPLAPVVVSTSPHAPVAINTSPLTHMAVSASPLAPVVVSTSPHAPVAINTSPLAPVAVSTSPLVHVAVNTSPLAPVAVSTSHLAHVAVSTSPLAPVAISTSPLAHVTVSTSPLLHSTTHVAYTSSPLMTTPTSAAKIQSRRSIFPFNNSSHPNDGDSDILPYPTHIVTPKPSKGKKYFVLTSEEVINEKLKQAEVKKEKELKKASAKEKRLQKQKDIQANIAQLKNKKLNSKKSKAK